MPTAILLGRCLTTQGLRNCWHSRESETIKSIVIAREYLGAALALSTEIRIIKAQSRSRDTRRPLRTFRSPSTYHIFLDSVPDILLVFYKASIENVDHELYPLWLHGTYVQS